MKAYIHLFTIILLILTGQLGFSQSAITVSGRIIDETGEPIQFASVLLQPWQYAAQSNNKGEFSFKITDQSLKTSKISTLEIQVFFVGKKSHTKSYTWIEVQRPISITLQDNSLTLEQIEIEPALRHSKNSISSRLFNEEAIERVQAFSLMDVLNTLPGKQTVAPNINAPQTLTLRNALDQSHSLNNSLGIPIIMDGIYLSNDANMQARPVAQRGMGGSALPAVTKGNTADVPFQGIDLREIPVEAIEKIEVIQGVASAEYGELTDGAILIERKAGRSPWHVTTNINAGSSNFSLNKGFDLPQNWGGLTSDLNYAISTSDPRDKVQKYDRYGASIRWNTPRIAGFRNKLSLDYNWKNDQAKLDPDDGSERQYFSKQQQFRISNSLNIKIDRELLKTIDFQISYSEGNQNSYSQWLLNQPNKGYSVKDTTGIYEGIVLNGQYLAVEQIIGNPVSAQGGLKFSTEISRSKSLHQFTYGFDANYNNNGGRGIISDPDRPRFVNINDQNIRPYSFQLTPSVINAGAYFADRIQYEIGQKKASSNLGVRMSFQNGSWNWQPRLQTNLTFNKQWNMGLAYGISTKSPTLLHRYPVPSWIDIPIILAYNSDASLYLVYTEKFETENKNLKPIQSHQAEMTLNHQNSWFNLHVNLFYKGMRDGYNSAREYQSIRLPNYEYAYNPATQKIDYWTNGSYTNFHDKSYYTIENMIGSDTYGLDWSVQIKKIKPIQTQINFSTSYLWSGEKNPYLEVEVLKSPINIDGQNIWHGLYEPKSSVKSFALTSKLGTTTHIPSLGFVLMTNTDVFWIKRRLSQYGNLIQRAKGYLDTEMNRVLIQENQPNPIPNRNITESITQQPMVYANFSMSVAKEIGKKIRIAITAYNAFNLRPEYSYTNPDTGIETITLLNSPLSITGGISFKL